MLWKKKSLAKETIRTLDFCSKSEEFDEKIVKMHWFLFKNISLQN